MNLRTKLSMFALTRAEQRTIAFIVLAVTLGLITQHYRQREPEPIKSPNEYEQPELVVHSPTPDAAKSTQPALRKQGPPEGRASLRGVGTKGPEAARPVSTPPR